VKNVMDWLKGHWAILALSLVAIAALPASLYFSLQMSAKLKEEVQKRADETHRAITENKVTYRIVTPSGQSALEKSTIVNKVYTEAYAKEYEAEAAKAKALAERGELDKARHLAARLREFRNPLSAEFFAECDKPLTAGQEKPFQCEPPQQRYDYSDFR